MKLFRFAFFLGLVTVLLVAGCKKDIDPPRVNGLVYVNQTDFPVTVTLQGEELISQGASKQIPARANLDGKEIIRVYSFYPFLSSCSFTFGDGKKIEYDLNDDDSNMDNGNPLWLGSYQRHVEKQGLCVYLYFTITEEHYRMAE